VSTRPSGHELSNETVHAASTAPDSWSMNCALQRLIVTEIEMRRTSRDGLLATDFSRRTSRDGLLATDFSRRTSREQCRKPSSRDTRVRWVIELTTCGCQKPNSARIASCAVRFIRDTHAARRGTAQAEFSTVEYRGSSCFQRCRRCRYWRPPHRHCRQMLHCPLRPRNWAHRLHRPHRPCLAKWGYTPNASRCFR
jgi:hypothetical protein